MRSSRITSRVCRVIRTWKGKRFNDELPEAEADAEPQEGAASASASVSASGFSVLTIPLCLHERTVREQRIYACGAAEQIVLGERDGIIDAVKRLTDGAGCERVIEAVGTQGPLELAGELTRERGRLISAGFHQDGARQINMYLWNWRGLDVINAHERDPAVYVEGMRAALTALEQGVLRTDTLYTHRMPLDRLGEALELMRERPDGFLKALVIA